MKLHIQTQIYENYGTAAEPHWKAKGGDDYFISNVTEDEVKDLLRIHSIEMSRDFEYYQENIIYHKLVEDDFESSFPTRTVTK